MTAIAAIDDRHCRCHTVDDNNHQKPAVIARYQCRQERSSSTEAAVYGSRGNGGLHQQQSLLEGVLGWRDNDTMALAGMMSLANGGGGDGGCYSQLCHCG